MMEYWVLGNWDVGTLEKFIGDMGGKISNNKNIPLKTTFHYSMCGAKTYGARKTTMISCSFTNSETYD